MTPIPADDPCLECGNVADDPTHIWSSHSDDGAHPFRGLAHAEAQEFWAKRPTPEVRQVIDKDGGLILVIGPIAALQQPAHPEPTGCTVDDDCYLPDGHDGAHVPLAALRADSHDGEGLPSRDAFARAIWDTTEFAEEGEWEDASEAQRHETYDFADALRAALSKEQGRSPEGEGAALARHTEPHDCTREGPWAACDFNRFCR